VSYLDHREGKPIDLDDPSAFFRLDHRARMAARRKHLAERAVECVIGLAMVLVALVALWALLKVRFQ
jgi:hypothetical protein